MPVVVLHGAYSGPTVWLNAAIHGDEVCGVEIIRQVLAGLQPEVRLHEPDTALFAGVDGLEVLRAIAADVRRVVRPGGTFAMRARSSRPPSDQLSPSSTPA